MKKLIVFAASLLVSVAAFAQETNKDANGNKQYGPYETNKFWDNWFIGVGGGVNATLDVLQGGAEFAGLAIQVDAGKWITPEYGARLSWRGLNNTVNGGSEAFNFVKADFLLHFSNLVAGYKELRKWDVIPLAGVGVLIDDQAGFEYGVELGLLNNFRLSDHFDLNLELGGNVAPGSRYGNYGRFVAFPYATLGVAYKFNRADWTRKATTVAAYTAAVAAAKAAADQAAADKDAAEAAKAAAQDSEKALADENQKLKDELAAAQAQNNYGDLFDEPIVAYFEIGQAKLTAKEKEHVKYVAKNIIARGENVKFTLSGNADSKTGSKKRNQQLSEQRADYVYKMMTEELGIDGSRFTVKANGANDVFDSPELNRAVIIEKQ